MHEVAEYYCSGYIISKLFPLAISYLRQELGPIFSTQIMNKHVNVLKCC
jgi:hypothetical protein